MESEAIELLTREIANTIDEAIYSAKNGIKVNTVYWKVKRNGSEDAGFRYAIYWNGKLHDTNASGEELKNANA
jgi:hypothetical protein